MNVTTGSTADQVIRHLEQHCGGTYDTRSGKIQCKSPFRQGDNPRAFELKISNDEHGTWYDFVRGEGGSLYDLADKLGIARPKGTGRSREKQPDTELIIGSFQAPQKKTAAAAQFTVRRKGRTRRRTRRPAHQRQPVQQPGGQV